MILMIGLDRWWSRISILWDVRFKAFISIPTWKISRPGFPTLSLNILSAKLWFMSIIRVFKLSRKGKFRKFRCLISSKSGILSWAITLLYSVSLIMKMFRIIQSMPILFNKWNLKSDHLSSIFIFITNFIDNQSFYLLHTLGKPLKKQINNYL